MVARRHRPLPGVGAAHVEPDGLAARGAARLGGAPPHHREPALRLRCASDASTTRRRPRSAARSGSSPSACSATSCSRHCRSRAATWSITSRTASSSRTRTVSRSTPTPARSRSWAVRSRSYGARVSANCWRRWATTPPPWNCSASASKRWRPTTRSHPSSSRRASNDASRSPRCVCGLRREAPSGASWCCATAPTSVAPRACCARARSSRRSARWWLVSPTKSTTRSPSCRRTSRSSSRWPRRW